MNAITNPRILTMSSREIAELVESRHDSVKRSMERLAESGIISITPTVEPAPDRGGKPAEVLLVNKRDSYVVVAQLSPEFTARLVDRWQELEDKVASKGVSVALPSKRSAGVLTKTKAALLFHREMVAIGVEPNLSLVSVMQATEEFTGLPTEKMRKALTVEPANIASFNQTELGVKTNLSSHEIGRRLRACGLMTNDAHGARVITEEGKRYGAMVPFTKNGHSGYEPRWFESVLSVIATEKQVAA